MSHISTPLGSIGYHIASFLLDTYDTLTHRIMTVRWLSRNDLRIRYTKARALSVILLPVVNQYLSTGIRTSPNYSKLLIRCINVCLQYLLFKVSDGIEAVSWIAKSNNFDLPRSFIHSGFHQTQHRILLMHYSMWLCSITLPRIFEFSR